MLPDTHQMLETRNKLHDRKKPGNCRVDKLRIIFLYEADFNFLNKKLGRDTLRQAENHNQVTTEQNGSHRGGQHREISQALNKILTFNII